MRKWSVLLIGLFLLFASGISTFAQNDTGTPACSKDEMNTTFQKLDIDVTNLDKEIQAAADTTKFISNAPESQLSDLITNLNDVQNRWWTETGPALPPCALARDLSIIIGRSIDENLIALALIQSGHNDLAEAHLQQTNALAQAEVERIKQALGESNSTTQPTVAPTASSESSSAKVKVGHWEGSGAGNFVEQVSFRVTENGTITNFTMQTNLTGTRAPCDVVIPAQEVAINPDGSFVIDLGTGSTVEGKFDSETTVSAKYGATLRCQDHTTTLFDPHDRTWTANWKSS